MLDFDALSRNAYCCVQFMVHRDRIRLRLLGCLGAVEELRRAYTQMSVFCDSWRRQVLRNLWCTIISINYHSLSFWYRYIYIYVCVLIHCISNVSTMDPVCIHFVPMCRACNPSPRVRPMSFYQHGWEYFGLTAESYHRLFPVGRSLPHTSQRQISGQNWTIFCTFKIFQILSRVKRRAQGGGFERLTRISVYHILEFGAISSLWTIWFLSSQQ